MAPYPSIPFHKNMVLLSQSKQFHHPVGLQLHQQYVGILKKIISWSIMELK